MKSQQKQYNRALKCRTSWSRFRPCFEPCRTASKTRDGQPTCARTRCMNSKTKKQKVLRNTQTQKVAHGRKSVRHEEQHNVHETVVNAPCPDRGKHTMRVHASMTKKRDAANAKLKTTRTMHYGQRDERYTRKQTSKMRTIRNNKTKRTGGAGRRTHMAWCCHRRHMQRHGNGTTA